MGINTNSELSNELRDVLKIQTNVNNIPAVYEEKIIPVVDVNPKHARRCNIHKLGALTTANTNATLYTTPTDEDFFLCSGWLDVCHDVASQGTNTVLNYTPETGATDIMLSIMNIVGEARKDCMSIDYNQPIKCKRGTNITITSYGVNVGTFRGNCGIHGYTTSYKA